MKLYDIAVHVCDFRQTPTDRQASALLAPCHTEAGADGGEVDPNAAQRRGLPRGQLHKVE